MDIYANMRLGEMSISLEYIRNLSAPEKVRTFGEMKHIIQKLGEAGTTPILTQGVFDIVHVGHIGYLHASQNIDPNNGLIIVGVENDETVRLNKGDTRPVNPLEDRLQMLAEFMSTALVFAYEDTPNYTKPDEYIARQKALGSTIISVPVWDPHFDLKTYQANEAGSRVAPVDYKHLNSTTLMLQKVGFEE